MITADYSTYTSRVSGLIGIPYDSMTSDEQSSLQGFFTTAMNSMWNSNNWMDVCPYGEARIAGNLLTYANKPANTAWTSTNVTATNDSILNPVDGRITAGSVLETSATGLHHLSQSYNQVPASGYTFSCFIYPNGRRYIYLWVLEATSSASHYAIFDTQTGLQSSVSSLTGDSASITQCSNGFYLCQLNYVSGAYGTAGPTASARIGTSSTLVTNPASASFAGSTSAGFYTWGPSVFQTSNTSPNSTTIPYEQTGEEKIDIVLAIYATNPSNTSNPRQLGYTLTPDGIQIIGSQITSGYWNFPVTTASTNFGYQLFQPVYLWYRKQIPDYSGSDYDATATYAVDDQILFEDSDGVLNFWKCIVATSAGQSPDTTPTSWDLLEIPDSFLLSAVYSGYADWLRNDGQLEKAAAMDNKSQTYMDQESDRQERQSGWVPPMKVQTYVTSQGRR